MGRERFLIFFDFRSIPLLDALTAAMNRAQHFPIVIVLALAILLVSRCRQPSSDFMPPVRSEPVELISLSDPDKVFSDYLTEPLGEGDDAVLWLNASISIENEQGFGPATPASEEEYPFWDYLSNPEALLGVPRDSFYYIGGNPDGENFYYSTSTRQFYLVTHSPDQLIPISPDPVAFVNQITMGMPELVPGSPRGTFGVVGDFDWTTYQRKQRRIDQERLVSQLRELLPGADIYQGSGGIHLVDRQQLIAVRYHHGDMRGEKGSLLLQAKREETRAAILAAIDAVLTESGFHRDGFLPYIPEKSLQDHPQLLAYLQSTTDWRLSGPYDYKTNAFSPTHRLQCWAYADGTIGVKGLSRSPNGEPDFITESEEAAIAYIKSRLKP